jgi:hypothetical protein
VRVEEVEHAIDPGQEGTGIWRITEEEVVIAHLENPVEGKSSDNLRYMRWETGLSETFGGD